MSRNTHFFAGRNFFWKHEVSHKEGIPNLGKLLVESLVWKKLRYPLKAKIYCFQVLEMRKVPTQSIEKRGRETRETSRQDDFFQTRETERRRKKGGKRQRSWKRKNEMGARRRGVRNGGRKGEEILNILLRFVSKKYHQRYGQHRDINCFHCTLPTLLKPLTLFTLFEQL